MSHQYDITIKAGSALPQPVPESTVFVCLSASAAFKVSPTGQGTFDINSGLGFGNPSGKRFSFLQFINTSSNDITVSFWVGLTEFRGPAAVLASASGGLPTTIKDAVTYLKGSSLLGLAGGANTRYSGLDGANVRKQISVDNMDGGNVLYVLDDNLNVFSVIQPLQSKTWITSGALRIKNPGGGSHSIRCGRDVLPMTWNLPSAEIFRRCQSRCTGSVQRAA